MSGRSVARRRGPLDKYGHNWNTWPIANVVTISRPEVVALIEEAAVKLTQGSKTEAVALVLRHLLEATARSGSLVGAYRHSVRIHPGCDLLAPGSETQPKVEDG